MKTDWKKLVSVAVTIASLFGVGGAIVATKNCPELKKVIIGGRECKAIFTK